MADTLFESGKIRDAWYDIYGLLKKVSRPKRSSKSQKSRLLPGVLFVVTTSLLGYNVGAKPAAPVVPTQLTLEWPSPPTAAYTKQQLADAVHALRRAGSDVHGDKLTAPNAQSLNAAEKILSQLPNFIADATVGVDGDGNVYFCLKQAAKSAYLTIEPRLIHLLIMELGQKNVYLDDEPFKGKVLPFRVRELLAKSMT